MSPSHARQRAIGRIIASLMCSGALMLALSTPAAASVPRTTQWVCQVPEDDHYTEVVFVSVPAPASAGITRANMTAGTTFASRFGEICTVR
jgi:hypothetical protein